MDYRYASSFNTETEARAVGKDMPISTKQSIEICNFLRGRSVEESKKILDEVIVLKRAIPYKRFNADLGHKRGKIAAGRYPKKASAEILKIMKLVEANAKNKGLMGKLRIRHLAAHQASRPLRHGRRYGLEAKRTHVEIIVTEAVGKKKEEQPKADVKKDIPKKEENPKVAGEEKKEAKPANHEEKASQSGEKKEQPKDDVKKDTPKNTEENPKLAAEKKEQPKDDVKKDTPKKEEKAEVKK